MAELLKLIRRSDLANYLPYKPTQLYVLERDDPSFPKAIPLSEGGRAVAYVEDEVIAYQQKLLARRAEKIAAKTAK